jgi:gamma-glutamyltranspeptidase/glutathione hydrolase
MIKHLLAGLLLSASIALPIAAQENTAPVVAGGSAGRVASGDALVSSADPRASDAGREILAAGGSAADAAMATMLALTVVEPQSSGIGGGGFFVYHDAQSGEIITIDGREEAPSAATPARFLTPDGRPMSFREAVPGGRSVGVPGNISLMAEVHRRFGRLPWRALFRPAIRLAEEGFVVSPWLATALQGSEERWASFPETRRHFFIDGRPARAGERLNNPELAAVLREVARGGPDAFYTGRTARAIVEAVTTAPRNPGDMTLADLAAYQAQEREPVCFQYRVYRLCGMGPPSSGATTVFGILGMLEGYDMRTMGRNNPMSWHLLSEAMRLAYADRDAFVGDPDHVEVPVAGLLDEAYLAERARRISPFRAADSYPVGSPPGAPPRIPAPAAEVPSTSHFVAIDRAGNVASMTSTIEGVFGSQIVARGMVLNNELTDFSMVPERDGALVANRVEPGKRPRSSMSPTIVYDAEGRPILAVGSAGGPRIIMHVAKTLIGVLDWDLPVEEALALPNLYMAGEGNLLENTEEGIAMAPQLARFGRTVLNAELGSKLNAAERDEDGSGWTGAADPRSVGAVAVE